MMNVGPILDLNTNLRHVSKNRTHIQESMNASSFEQPVDRINSRTHNKRSSSQNQTVNGLSNSQTQVQQKVNASSSRRLKSNP